MSNNRYSTRLIIVFAAMILAFSCAVPGALAAGSASVSSATVTQGSNVALTVTFSGGGTAVGAVDAYVSYDSSMLQFVSGSSATGGGGSVHIVGITSSTNQKSLSFSLTFKALKAGSTTVSVSTNEFLSYDGNEIGRASGSGKVTIKAPATPTVKPTAKPTVKPTVKPTAKPGTPTPTPEPTDIETAIKVTVEGGTRYLWRSLKNVKEPMPAGHTAQAYTYHNETIQGALGNSGVVFLYLTDEKGENGAYYIYDADADAFIRMQQIAVQSSDTYIILPLPKDLGIPEGYEAASLKLSDSLTVPAWAKAAAQPTPEETSAESPAPEETPAQPEVPAPEFYLLYAMNGKGEKGFYQYDAVEKTMQRYAGAVEDISAVKPVEPEPTPAPKQGLLETIMGDSTLMMVVFGLAALCLILLIAVIILAVKRKRGGKPPRRPAVPQSGSQEYPVNSPAAEPQTDPEQKEIQGSGEAEVSIKAEPAVDAAAGAQEEGFSLRRRRS